MPPGVHGWVSSCFDDQGKNDAFLACSRQKGKKIMQLVEQR
jgi:hypothetical protein